MFTYLSLRRIAFLATIALSTGCAASDAEEEESNASSQEELTGAGAGIVPLKSIRGIALGMTPREVRRVLGKPDRESVWNGEHVIFYEYGLTHIDFDHREQVKKVRTRSPGVRTKENVGVGSLKPSVDALTASNCYSRHYFDSEIDHVGDYHVCEILAGTVRTLFFFADDFEPDFSANARVKEIRLEHTSEPLVQ